MPYTSSPTFAAASKKPKNPGDDGRATPIAMMPWRKFAALNGTSIPTALNAEPERERVDQPVYHGPEEHSREPTWAPQHAEAFGERVDDLGAAVGETR